MNNHHHLKFTDCLFLTLLLWVGFGTLYISSKYTVVLFDTGMTWYSRALIQNLYENDLIIGDSND